MKKLMKLLAAIAIAAGSFNLAATAVANDRIDNAVQPLSEYVELYNERYDNALFRFTHGDGTPEERAIQFAEEVQDIKNKFQDQRRGDYKAYRLVKQAGQSCTNGRPGKKKTCNAPTLSAPANHYLVDATIVGGGAYTRNRTNTELSWKVVKTGKGRNHGTATAFFAYSADYIESQLNAEYELLRTRR